MASRFDWETIRAEYETGATQSELSRKHGCSRTAIQKRIEREGWVQDVSDAIDRLAQAKVAGVVAGCNPEKKAAAVEAAADRKASVIQGHRDAWPDIKELNRRAIAENNFDLAKLAKLPQICRHFRRDHSDVPCKKQQCLYSSGCNGSPTHNNHIFI